MHKPLVTVLVGMMTLATVAYAQLPGQTPVREIVQVRGELYVVRADGSNTVLLVTSDGIVMGDPINVEVAAWLKGEIDRRFSRPVRHIVYSHHDVDHVRGASAFPEATIWAHENFPKNLQAPWRRLGEGVDANRNGQLEMTEAKGVFPTYFARFDQNRDGALTAAEFNGAIVPPSRTFATRQSFTLGGRTVELLYPGHNHSDDATVVYFPSERAAFGVDFVSPGLVPDVAPDFDNVPLSEWVASLKAIEALDIDILVPGHGAWGTKVDVATNRKFFEDLASGVQQGLLEGRDVEELKKRVTLDRYVRWPGFVGIRPSLVESAAQNLRTWPDQFRTEVTVTVIGSVRKGGLFTVPKGTTIRQVLERAGGADERADMKGLRLMRIVGFDRREYDATPDDVFLHNDTVIVPRTP